MLIIQISDIHVGPEFRDDVFHRAVDEINELDPDLLLVTGDLTENGLLSQYEGAAELMKQFTCRRRLYTSGNHDYRSTGYLLFRQFFPSKPVLRTRDLLVATLGTARPERNDGEAGHRQIVWLENLLRQEKRRFKLVMMHHHLVPVPDTGPNTIPILDAGGCTSLLGPGWGGRLDSLRPQAQTVEMDSKPHPHNSRRQPIIRTASRLLFQLIQHSRNQHGTVSRVAEDRERPKARLQENNRRRIRASYDPIPKPLRLTAGGYDPSPRSLSYFTRSKKTSEILGFDLSLEISSIPSPTPTSPSRLTER